MIVLFSRALRFSFAALALLLAACATAPERAETRAGARSAEQIVVLVGLDGLRPASLVEWPDAAPAINALGARGVRAEGLIPVMPSKTFPDFYSIATGLHPDRHGITSNTPYSRSMDRIMARDAHGEGAWWGGEPIWVTAEKQGVRAAAMFWLGSEAEIGGVRPTHWSPYEHEKPYGERIDQVLGWLAMPEAARPRFITVYFDAVDTAGHMYGPGSPEERAAIERVDAEIARLVEGVAELGIEDRTNVIVVSDHGMAAVGEEQVVYLDDYHSLGGVFIPVFQVEDTAGYGVMVHLYTDEPRAVRDALDGAHPALSVYLREDLPARWRLDHPDRTGDLVVLAEPGWVLFARSLTPKYEGLPAGMHGYDRHLMEMRGSFAAAGPAFASGLTVDAFENVEIYNIIAEIIGVEPAANDGDIERVRALLAPSR